MGSGTGERGRGLIIKDVKGIMKLIKYIVKTKGNPTFSLLFNLHNGHLSLGQSLK